MSRPDRDQLGLLLATAWSLRATCARRKVGCVLMDSSGYLLASGYNGPPSGFPHCTSNPCPGVGHASGTALELCLATHAETNACLRLADPRAVDTCYTTTSPCSACTSLLLNTSCRRIVYIEEYPHEEARRRWAWRGREWLQVRPKFMIEGVT